MTSRWECQLPLGRTRSEEHIRDRIEAVVTRGAMLIEQSNEDAVHVDLCEPRVAQRRSRRVERGERIGLGERRPQSFVE